MTQADRVHSTPRITASKTNPPVDPTRRRVISLAVGAIAATVPAAAVAESMATGASPALIAALAALQASRARLEESRVAYNVACTHVDRWEAENPQPASKRGRRPWLKRESAYCYAVSGEQWQDVLCAEVDFHRAQEAVAAIECAGPADLQLMIEASTAHDSRQLSIINRAPIARAVVAHIAEMARGGQS
jgi:hypothetical protein